MMHRLALFFLLALFFAGLIGMTSVGMIEHYMQSVIMLMGINIILCSSLNLVNGYMGEFSCGHAGFMGVGAYVSSVFSVWLFADGHAFGSAVLAPETAVFFFPLILIAGALAAAKAGLLVAIPAFKIRGDHLALITLASLFIIKICFENVSAIGGSRGFTGMRFVVAAMENVVFLPWMMIWTFLATVFTLVGIHRFLASSYGKKIIVVSEDRASAETMAANTDKAKIMAFTLSAGLAGLAGGLFAHLVGYVNPDVFGTLRTMEIMVMSCLAGMGSLVGSIIAAILFTLLLEVMQPLHDIKSAVVSMMLIAMILIRPGGIMGVRKLSEVFATYRFSRP